MAKPNPVVHFEMGYKDKQRMADFYTKVFGWQTQMTGPEMGNYVVVQTGEGENPMSRPTKPGYINGGFYEKKGPSSEAPSVVIAVDDINQAVKDVQAAGGTILGAMGPDGQKTMEPTMIPGVGLWISIQDTEGNRVSMLQPKGM